MVPTKLIATNKLQPNTGQIEGLPQNPRFIRDERFEKLKQSIMNLPSMLELRELIVVPHEKGFVVIAGNMRYRAGIEIGLLKMPCKVLDPATPAAVLAEIAIKDNVPFGDDDRDLLATEWTDFPLEEWGMEQDPLEDIDVNDEPNLADPNFSYASQYGVIVKCRDEAHQQEVFDQLVGAGHDVKVVVV